MTFLCVSEEFQTLSNLRLAKKASCTSLDIVHELLGLFSNTATSQVTNEIKEDQNFAFRKEEVADLNTVKDAALCCRNKNTEDETKLRSFQSHLLMMQLQTI